MSAVTIESDDKEGEEIYRKIILDVLSGLRVQFVEHLYVKINIREGYFIISAIIKKNIKPLKLSDISNLDFIQGGIRITIDPMQERFLPNVLRAVTSLVGKERILQPSRYEIIIKGVDYPEIKDLTVFDYATYAQEMITEILFWIAPEQFRITHILNDEEATTILFSEYDLKGSWLEEEKKIHELIKTNV
ncbi:MAG: methanogenesis marker 17 protein [archaeon]|nr:methanogenesis marker 17 protein [archaeon]MCP8315114.1 methanogenesis marker 17 protein [archaeon]